MNERRDDVIIVGGGIVGLFAADALVDAGLRVRVLERNHRVGMESSWAGAGVLAPLYPWRYPDAIDPLVRWSQAHYPRIVARLRKQTGIDAELDCDGMVICEEFTSDPGFSSWFERSGAEMLERGDPRLTGIALPDWASAVYLPAVARVRNPRLIQALAKSLVDRGVRIDCQSQVLEIDEAGDGTVMVRTTDTRHQASQLVMACGAWVNGINGLDDVGLPVEPVKGQILLLGAASSVPEPVVLSGGVYSVRRRDGRVLIGSTVDHSGFDARPTASAGEALLGSARRLLPGLQHAVLEAQWAGLRPGIDGGVPLIGHYPGRENIYVNVGHFRTGLTTAPASAQVLIGVMGYGGSDSDRIRWNSGSFDPGRRVACPQDELPAGRDGCPGG